MKIFDSHEKNGITLNNVSISEKRLLFANKSDASIFLTSIGSPIIKIVGRRITGSGILTLTLRNDNNNILYSEKITFATSGWSEKIIKPNIKTSSFTISIERSASDLGRVEVGRIIVEDPEKISNILKNQNNIEDNEYQFFMPKQKLRIGIIIPYGIYGGAEVYLKDILQEAGEDYSIDILYTKRNALQSHLNNKLIRHNVFASLEALKTNLINSRYDTVIFYNSKNIYNLLVNLKEESLLESSLVEIYHSDFQWSDSLSTLKERRYVNKILRISPGLCNDIQGLDDRNKIFVPIGLDLIRFGTNNISTSDNKVGQKVFGLVARLSPEKNIEYAIDLFKNLNNYTLKIIGSGPSESNLKKMVQDAGARNIEFLGYKDDIEMYYKNFDAFILTSKMEGVPISILEAMSYGLPIFTTPVGQIPEYLSGNDGIYFLTSNIKEDIKILTKTQIKKFTNLIDFINSNHNILRVRETFFKSLNNDASIFEEYDNISKLISCEYI